jgi:2,3-bisphosphoglycerate-independent phosphoglycerate mutase
VVDVLVIPDGAAQPPRVGVPTALEAANTPALDALAADGGVLRVATTPSGLPAGSETGIASLLGAPPRHRVGRGWVDAAAYGIEVPDGMTPWRADVVYRSGKRASIRQARDVCVHLGREAHAVSGHRLVLIAPARPADRRLLGLYVRVWPAGRVPEGRVPVPTVVVCARGAAAGCARLLDARVVIPAGATGDVDADLGAKAQAVIAALESDAERVVVHVGAADEAAHRRQPEAVIAALERIDAELVAPLRHTVGARGGRLAVCPDHGTDPITGRHDPAPVPAVVWGDGVASAGPSELSERAVRGAPVTVPDQLFAARAGAAIAGAV